MKHNCPKCADLDTFAAAADTLAERIHAGRITPRNLRAAYRLHLWTLTRAGFDRRAAECAFWDTVLTARAEVRAIDAHL